MSASLPEPPEPVARQLAAYNRRDLTSFAACYAPDVVLEDARTGPFVRGLAELEARYGALFRDHPENRARVLNRSVAGPWTFEDEEVSRDAVSASGERTPQTFRVLVVYRVEDGQILRATFFR